MIENCIVKACAWLRSYSASPWVQTNTLFDDDDNDGIGDGGNDKEDSISIISTFFTLHFDKS